MTKISNYSFNYKTPIPMMLEHCVNKKRIQSFFDQYSTEYTTEIQYLMFKLINFIVFLQVFTNFECDAYNPFKKKKKKLGRGNKRLGMLNSEQVNWKQVNVMIGYERNILESLSRSLCDCERPLREKIAQQVSQSTSARNSVMSSSKVHNIIKTYRDSGEISACKQRGLKTNCENP